MFDVLKNLFWPDRTFGVARSSQWGWVRKEYLMRHPECAMCGKRRLLRSNEVHHVKPFNLFPELEMEISNLITLCRTCHLSWGHLFSFRSYNPDIWKDVQRIENRP